jgi:hypothetical protein
MQHRLAKILCEPLDRVARGIDGDEDGLDGLALGVETFEHARHLSQLLGADVRALGEPKVQQCPLAVQVGVRHATALRVDEREGPTEVGLAHLALRRHLPRLLVLVQPVQRRERCRG